MTEAVTDNLLASLNRSMVRSDELARAVEFYQQTFTKILRVVVPRCAAGAITAQRDAQHDSNEIMNLCVEAKARAPHDAEPVASKTEESLKAQIGECVSSEELDGFLRSSNFKDYFAELPDRHRGHVVECERLRRETLSRAKASRVSISSNRID